MYLNYENYKLKIIPTFSGSIVLKYETRRRSCTNREDISQRLIVEYML